jgi:hypothetical protein
MHEPTVLHCGHRGYMRPPAIFTTNTIFLRVQSPGIWLSAACSKSIDVSKEHVASIFRVREQINQENRVKADGKQRHVLPKVRLTFKGLHGVTSYIPELILTTAVGTSNHTRNVVLVENFFPVLWRIFFASSINSLTTFMRVLWIGVTQQQ